jgi:hypothetical protein
MLNDVEIQGESHIVSFLPHGRAFMVHDVDQFVGKVLPKYFKHTAWNSFTRQLSLYGFHRATIESGPDSGAYYHELLLRGRKGLCLYMRRVGVPQKQCDRRRQNNTKEKVHHHHQPDFYLMKALS